MTTDKALLEAASAPAKVNRREQQRSIDTRQTILTAALEEFAERGFDGASMRRIGERAGLDFTLITYHFRNKEALWRAVASYGFEAILAAWDEDIPDVSTLSPQERVKVEFRAFLLFTTSHPAFYGFMLHEMHSGSPRLQWVIDNFLSKIRSRILPQIISSQQDGQLPAGDPNLLYYMLVGAATVLSALSGEIAATTGKSISDQKVASEYWELLEKVFFGTPAIDRVELP
jgi:TetR/AcrR family transcriptional regulator